MIAPIKSLAPAFAALVALVALCSCGVYHGDVTTFHAPRAGYQVAAGEPGGPLPHVRIDTNIKFRSDLMFWGTARSRGPYTITLEYTDNDYAYDRLEITLVEVRYADGSTEPAADAIPLPASFAFTPYQSVNSTSGGAVTTEVSLLREAGFPKAITRDSDFTLRLEGRFVGKDGGTRRFSWQDDFEFRRESETAPLMEVLKEV